MNEETSKYTGYHRCQGDIANFKVRIRIREENPDNVRPNKEDKWHIKEFSWQQKHFSKTEQEIFDESPELEQVNNDTIAIPSGSRDEKYYLFTYVQDDEFISEEETHTDSICKNTYLQKYLDNLNVDSNPINKYEEYDFNGSLTSCFNNCALKRNCEKMYIMADMGEYVDDIWIKDEHVLCALTYDKNSKVLSVYPDFSTTVAYTIRTVGEEIRKFSYFIENGSANIPDSDIQKEQEILRIIDDYKRNIRNRIVGDKFYVPPKNKFYVYLFFEITTGKNFENNNVYVQYTIDLPENWECENTSNLTGVTQTCHGSTVDEGLIHFGHTFEVVLQYDLEKLDGNISSIPKNPCIYFEVISRRTWDRYTSEGLAYKDIPVSQPGCYNFDMLCFRFRPNGFLGELRRSFIGDYSNYKDVRWIGAPRQQAQKCQNKYGVHTLSTGELNIRINIINQSQAFLQEFREGERKEKFIYEKLNSSSLIRSVNEVLLAFRKVRNNLIEVRKNV